jgi:hypothetical protein
MQLCGSFSSSKTFYIYKYKLNSEIKIGFVINYYLEDHAKTFSTSIRTIIITDVYHISPHLKEDFEHVPQACGHDPFA